jgi:hypothetical protein
MSSVQPTDPLTSPRLLPGVTRLFDTKVRPSLSLSLVLSLRFASVL